MAVALLTRKITSLILFKIHRSPTQPRTGTRGSVTCTTGRSPAAATTARARPRSAGGAATTRSTPPPSRTAP
jgi:hypothetical protein